MGYFSKLDCAIAEFISAKVQRGEPVLKSDIYRRFPELDKNDLSVSAAIGEIFDRCLKKGL